MVLWQPIFLQDALSCFGLQRSEPQTLVKISSDEKANGAVAQVAEAVEQEDQILCVVVHSFH